MCLPMRTNDNGLAGGEGKRGVVKVEREEHGPRCCLYNVNEWKSDDRGHLGRVYLSSACRERVDCEECSFVSC